ncbi:MAG: class I SAM-dependent methyltransferase [Bacillota bacterium]
MVVIGVKIIQSVVDLSHWFLSRAVQEGSMVIDATAGNGHDTLFLANLVGPSGKVYAFDIQEKALETTKALLAAHGLEERVQLIHNGHEKMDKYVPQKVHAVLFNLGYLPGGDRNIITYPDTTVQALNKSIHLLVPGGVLAIVVYWGHPGGGEEKEAVEEWMGQLSPAEYDLMKITFPNKNKAPYLIGVQKKSGRLKNEICPPKKNSRDNREL